MAARSRPRAGRLHRVAHRQLRRRAIHPLETRACVADADARRGRGNGRQPTTVVTHDQRERAIRRPSTDRDLVAGALAKHAMLERVFNEWLQHEGRNARVAQRLRDIDRDPQTVAEANLLDLEVAADEIGSWSSVVSGASPAFTVARSTSLSSDIARTACAVSWSRTSAITALRLLNKK